MKKEEILSIIKSLSDIIKTRYHAEVIGIFESWTRGEEEATSYIDVLIKFEEKADLFDFLGLSIFLKKVLAERLILSLTLH
jgi:predicted nucleotidyltransferase